MDCGIPKHIERNSVLLPVKLNLFKQKMYNLDVAPYKQTKSMFRRHILCSESPSRAPWTVNRSSQCKLIDQRRISKTTFNDTEFVVRKHPFLSKRCPTCLNIQAIFLTNVK